MVETRAEKQGGILIEGILHVSFLYLKADDALPFGNWQGMVPFSYLLECPDMRYLLGGEYIYGVSA